MNYNPFAGNNELQVAVSTTESQKEIWNSILLDESATGAFNESMTIKLEGPINVMSLEQAISKTINRHGALKTTFTPDGKNMMVDLVSSVDLERINLTNVSDDERQELFEKIIDDETKINFDLINGPVFRCKLISFHGDLHYLVASAHHIICDGWSWAIVMHDLGQFYNASLTHQDFSPESPYQLWQFSQDQIKRQENIDEHKKYWIELFKDGGPIMDLPIDFDRPEFRTYNSKRIDFELSSDLVKKLKRLSAKNGVSFYHTIYGSFTLLLHKLSEQNDLVVGISAAAQSILGKDELVGHCVNLLPIRNSVDPNSTVKSHIINTKEAVLSAYDNQEFTFGSLLKVIPLKRDVSRIPLVSVIFNIDQQPIGQGLDFKGLNCSYKTNPRHFENFEIFVNATVCGDHVVLETQYNTDLFSSDSINKWLSSLNQLLNIVSENIDIQIDKLPLDLTRKVAAAKKVAKRPIADAPQATVNQQTVDKLKTIWTGLLGDRVIKEEDNFFALGGHSLLASEMMLKIDEEFEVKIGLRDIFRAKSFADICCKIEDKLKTTTTTYEHKIKSVKHSGPIELSLQQFRAWYVQTLAPDTTLFNLPAAYHYTGNFDLNAYKQALNTFIARHEATRTVIKKSKSGPLMEILPSMTLDLEVETVSGKSLNSKLNNLLTILKKKASTTIQLEEESLFKVKLFKLDDNNFVCFTLIHHIIWDGWCYDIFRDEMAKLYQGFKSGQENILDNLPSITYRDYCLWQKEFLSGDEYTRQMNFWKSKLSGELPVLQLPLDRPRPKILNYRGSGTLLKWSEDEIVPLEIIAKKNGTTLFNLLLLGYKILLLRYSSQHDQIVGTPVRGRNHSGLDKLIGFFVNNLAIRTKLDSNKSVLDNLSLVSGSTADSFENAEVGFDDIVNALNVARNPSITPIYQTFFMFQDATNRKEGFVDMEFSSYPLQRGASHTDLDFWARRDRNGMTGGLDFMSDLFDPQTVERMGDDLKFILSSFIGNESIKLADLPSLHPQNRKLLIDGWNQTEVALPKQVGLHNLIEVQVDKVPNKVCFEYEDQTITYQELDIRANQVAHYLLKCGAKKGELIGIAIDRSIDMIVGILGILKSGAGYVPLDPDFPSERLEYMLEHSKCRYVLTNEQNKQLSVFSNVSIISIDGDKQPISVMPTTRTNIDLSPDDPCYVIYTSGSTGKPKGVQIPHSSAINFLMAMQKRPGMSSDDVFCAVTTLSFDIAVLELYLPLISGAKVVIVSRETALFGEQLKAILENKKVTIMQATPASWRLLIHAGWKGSDDFKSLCGGEPFPKDLASDLIDRVCEVWNMYGPTETTVWSTCKRIEHTNGPILIGKPIDNTTIYIFDDDMNLCPIGVPGELYIGGAGLATGYLFREDLTRERFIKNPLDPSKLIYKTGDLARYHQNGDLECLGRNDGQVKVRGYRIELGEIESVLASHSHVKQQVVIVREDRPGDVRIVAYYISSTGSEIPESELREHLKDKLPAYMIPAHFVRLYKFPMTLNEKIDRKELPPPFGEKTISEDDHFIAPSSKTEIALAKIWSEEIGVERIGKDDDFFNLGGHSLLSVRVFNRIHDELGADIQLSVLFESSTLSELANEIDKIDSKDTAAVRSNINIPSDWKSLVGIRPSGKNAPLFFIHGVGGNVLNYRKLLKHIDPNTPIFGLQSPGVDGKTELAESIHDMASIYAEEICMIDPIGPYTIVGGSMGGLLALEVARILKEQNREVKQLIMFDTFGPKYDVRRFGEQDRNFIQNVKTSLYYRIKTFLYGLQYMILTMFGIPIPHKIRYFNIEMNNYRLLWKHKTSTYDGDIELIRAPIKDKGWYADPQLGWSETIKGKINTYQVDSGHHDFVESEEVGKVFKEIIQ